MKQTFTSARRPLEILIHIISWGIMFGFPFFFVERGNGNINWMAYIRHLAVPLSFMIAFYVNYFILVPRYLFQSQAKRYVVYNIIFMCHRHFVTSLAKPDIRSVICTQSQKTGYASGMAILP